MSIIGIEKEGIYRLSCKKNELLELKIMAETNVHSVPYMSEDIDIHILTNLVKSYLREIPNPIFLFSTKDRVDYSSNFSQLIFLLFCSKPERRRET